MCNNLDKPLAHTEETTCPICGENNNCKHNEKCWCFSVTIPKELLEMIPEEKRGKACICKSCVEKYRSE
ncbi:cysteine-rich CWC family protein [Tissierella pigra]|uniref:Cysteine-rich CWC family protein n=1 Tax=Tissierella pigra TaxID=2607614 RepID=A0A6N7XX67_9FIRM|nr:cysteine-rich CWC family protein [Tissierella pigra]MBU5425601.1 cysteine-rich CWC family protein [Tissierella pigra]MSU00848.1 cysteine-rich CWC family protein [Tissierella pigra]